MNRHVPNVLKPFAAPYATREQRRDHAAGLRVLADWLEETRFPIPLLALNKSSYYDTTIDVPSVWIDDESFVKRAGSAARLIGGRVDKGVVDYTTDFRLERDFGGGVKFRYRIARDAVCEAREEVVEEEKYVPVNGVEARALESRIDELKKELAEKPREIRKVSVTKTVFDCPESLLAKPIEEPETESPVMLDESVPF